MKWKFSVGRMTAKLAILTLFIILSPQLDAEAAGADNATVHNVSSGEEAVPASEEGAPEEETITAETDAEEVTAQETITEEETADTGKSGEEAKTPDTEEAAAAQTEEDEKTEAEEELARRQSAALYTAKYTYDKLIAEGVTENEAIELVNQELENVADILIAAESDPEAARVLEEWKSAAEDAMAAIDEQEAALEEAQENTEYVYPATGEEIRLLAALIYCEAGNQSREGKVAVGNVVLNRIRSERFPDTMKEVIYQQGQFTPVESGWLGWVLRKGEIPESCFEAAKAALEGEAPVGNAVFFMRKTMNYSGKRIGAHFFWGTV